MDRMPVETTRALKWSNVMRSDAAFLAAIAEAPADEEVRRAYTKWLLKRGDRRGAFLRLQQAFRQPLADPTHYREMCQEEQALVAKLDPVWIQQVRQYTTAAPCRDIAALVPELRPFAQATTRLHPHRALAPLPNWASKIGGRFLWPKSEPWPSCSKCKIDLAPILQLRRRDYPQLSYPARKDLLQLFWCPNEAAHDYLPAPWVVLRATASVTDPRTDDPDLSTFPRQSDWQGLIPFECAVFPEHVVEYPISDDLGFFARGKQAERISELLENMDLGPKRDLRERFAAEHGPSEAHHLAFCELGECPGSKLGGRPPITHRSRRYEHFLTLSTWEFDSASFRRWMAVEDQRLVALPGKPLTWKRLFGRLKSTPFREVLGMQLGRTQRAHVYICRTKEPWHVVTHINS